MPESFDYLERRVQSQRQWHAAKATWNKRRYYTVEIVTLLSGAAIPVVNLWMVEDTHVAGLISAILGGLIVVAAGIGKLFKFQENWLQYRTLAESIRREEEHYLIAAAEYAQVDEPGRQRLLVERVESLLASTTTQFIATHRTTVDAGATSDPPTPS